METETARVQADPHKHRSVMVAEALEALAPRPGGVYLDATLGAGGHAEQILLRSAPDGKLYGIDRDAAALLQASARLCRFGDRFIPLFGPFGDAEALLQKAGGQAIKLDGLIADLGVSSMQLDTAERGFSFQQRGPIDMRMNAQSGETALDLIVRLDEEHLTDILREYGEERHARRIATAIKNAAATHALPDTLALADVVLQATPARDRYQSHRHPATRTFQALRIAVNDELRQLHSLLQAAPRLLNDGGRLAIISFHSLEDRLVKHVLRGGLFTPLSRKSQTPDESELSTNPRSRSARLRTAVLGASLQKGDSDDDQEEAAPC